MLTDALTSTFNALRRPALATTLVLLSFVTSYADAPTLINYQGHFSDNLGAPLHGPLPTIVFAVYDTDVGGVALWSETHLSLTADSGSVAVFLGSVEAMPTDLFNDSTRYLGVTIGSDAEISPRSRLVSVPYAMSALSAQNVSQISGATGGDISGPIRIGDGATTAKLVIASASGDSVVIHPASGVAIEYTDDTGGLLMRIGYVDSAAEISFYEPEDYVPHLRGSAVLKPKMVLSSVTGVTMFGATETDTTFRMKPNGELTGKGRITMGPNSSGAAQSTVLGFGNTATGDSSTISGGHDNLITPDAALSTIGGGASNEINGRFGVIGGGGNNHIDTTWTSTIGGGIENTIASGSTQATISGGRGNVVDSARGGAIGGGKNNKITSPFGMIPGGELNSVSGAYSLAAGKFASAAHEGSFVWTSNEVDTFTTTAPGQFNVRARGGIRLFTNPAQTAGVTLASGASSWSPVSDSTLKENITEIDIDHILESVAKLPITRWNYKAQDSTISHLGPMAQDFHRLFGLGMDDKHINTLDPDGVSLAAIKALYQRNVELREELDELQKRLSKLELMSK